MKNFVRRLFKSATPDDAVSANAVRECRSWHGISYHLRVVSQEDGLAFCGYEPLDDRQVVTFAQVQAALPLQHAGFKYCEACVKAFQNFSEEQA